MCQILLSFQDQVLVLNPEINVLIIKLKVKLEQSSPKLTNIFKHYLVSIQVTSYFLKCCKTVFSKRTTLSILFNTLNELIYRLLLILILHATFLKSAKALSQTERDSFNHF